MRRRSFEWPWRRWAHARRERNQWSAWLTDQGRALEAGEEIVPPWAAWPGEDPWWGGWRQGNAEGWLNLVWLPFWSGQKADDKQGYVARWAAPEEWRRYVLEGWDQEGEAAGKLAEVVLNKDRFTGRER